MELTSLQSESRSSSSASLNSASDASVSCGTMVSLTKLIAHSSLATERFSKEAVGVLLTWSAGKCSLVTALGLPCAYAAGGRVPALSFIVSPSLLSAVLDGNSSATPSWFLLLFS